MLQRRFVISFLLALFFLAGFFVLAGVLDKAYAVYVAGNIDAFNELVDFAAAHTDYTSVDGRLIMGMQEFIGANEFMFKTLLIVIKFLLFSLFFLLYGGFRSSEFLKAKK